MSWHVTPGFPSGPLTLPSERGCFPIAHPVVPMIQALSKDNKQQIALPDDLQKETITRYKRLCTSCGCHNTRELA